MTGRDTDHYTIEHAENGLSGGKAKQNVRESENVGLLKVPQKMDGHNARESGQHGTAADQGQSSRGVARARARRRGSDARGQERMGERTDGRTGVRPRSRSARANHPTQVPPRPPAAPSQPARPGPGCVWLAPVPRFFLRIPFRSRRKGKVIPRRPPLRGLETPRKPRASAARHSRGTCVVVGVGTRARLPGVARNPARNPGRAPRHARERLVG